MKKLETLAKEDTLFVLSGSIQKGVDKDIYDRITRLVHKKGCQVLMDADGALFVMEEKRISCPALLDELVEQAEIKFKKTFTGRIGMVE